MNGDKNGVRGCDNTEKGLPESTGTLSLREGAGMTEIRRIYQFLPETKMPAC